MRCVLPGSQQIPSPVEQISSLVPNYEPPGTYHIPPFALSARKHGGKSDPFQLFLAWIGVTFGWSMCGFLFCFYGTFHCTHDFASFLDSLRAWLRGAALTFCPLPISSSFSSACLLRAGVSRGSCCSLSLWTCSPWVSYTF